MAQHNGAARIVLQNVGGSGNVRHAVLSANGIRLYLTSTKQVNVEMISTQREFQYLNLEKSWLELEVRNDLRGVYDSIIQAGHFKAERLSADGTIVAFDIFDQRQSLVEKLIDIVSGSIAPIMGIICATGILKGVLAFFSYFGWLLPGSGEYQIWYAVADGAFYFLPILLGITSARQFKCNEWIGAALGISMVYPAIVNLTSTNMLGEMFSNTPFAMKYFVTFFGIPVVMPASGYTTSVIPVILTVYFAAKLERLFNTVLPAIVRGMFTPLLVLSTMMPLAFLFIGPVATLFCGVVQIAFSAIYNIPLVGGLLCGGLVGALWPVLVMFGFQWGLIPIKLLNLSTLGYDYLISPNVACSFTQATVVLAIFIKSKDQDFKTIAFPAFVSGILGISEPAIYGVNLPKKKPFVIACIGAGIAGGIVGFLGVRVFQMAGFGPFAFPGYIDPSGSRGLFDVIVALIATGIGGLFSFIAVFLTYKDGKQNQQHAALEAQ